MEPQTTAETTQSITTNVQTESIFAPLHKVTTVSKVLAAVVFIVLPFVGFYFGYAYAPTAVADKLDVIPRQSSSVARVTAPATSVLRFINMKSDSHDLSYQDSELEVVTQVNPINSDIETLLFSVPYFKQVASTSAYMVFTVYGLKGELANGLYKYDRTTGDFYEMKTSALYDSWYSRVVTSPDSKAIAVIGGANNVLVLGASVVLINLTEDATTTIAALSLTDNARFVGWCGAGCDEGEIKWVDDTHIDVVKFEIKCEDIPNNRCIFGEPILSKQLVRYDVVR